MSSLRLVINPANIAHNARMTASMCRSLNLEVVGVTKGAAGDPAVAQAMLDAGIRTLGDSRLENIARMRNAGIKAPIMLLRSPGPSEVLRCVHLADSSLDSDPGVMESLGKQARSIGKNHGIIVMVDLETGREGLPPSLAPEVCQKVQSFSGLELYGIGVYFHMTSRADFQLQALSEFVTLARKIKRDMGIRLPVISGGSSNVFRSLAVEDHQNPGINHLRVGTAILLGFSSSLNPVTIPGFERDTFIMEAEVIEMKVKKTREAILAVGRLDIEPRFLVPVAPGAVVRDATSDHLMVNVDKMNPEPNVGDFLSFRLGYPALAKLMISPYVEKEYVHPA
jgi:predicted amino acid racemase